MIVWYVSFIAGNAYFLDHLDIVEYVGHCHQWNAESPTRTGDNLINGQVL